MPPLSADTELQQWADDTLTRVTDCLEAGQCPSWPEVSARGPEWGSFQLHDGVVHRRWQDPRVGAPMERVGVDVLGPFPVTDSCPKLRSHWQGHGEILDRVSEVVYRLQMPGLGARGRVVVLHQDRLSPYRPFAPVVSGEGGAAG
ncbi:unnamed protein product [Arctogadus glacialis]